MSRGGRVGGVGRLRVAPRVGLLRPVRCLLTVAGLLGAAWALGSATAHAQESPVPIPGDLVPVVSVQVGVPEPLALGDAVETARETTETVGASRELTDTVTTVTHTVSEARDGATGTVRPVAEAVATAPADPGVEFADPAPAVAPAAEPVEPPVEPVSTALPAVDTEERPRPAPPTGAPTPEVAGPSVVTLAQRLAAVDPDHAPAERSAAAESVAPDGTAVTGQAQQNAPTAGPLLAGHLSAGHDIAPGTGTRTSRNGPVLASVTASDEPSFSPD